MASPLPCCWVCLLSPTRPFLWRRRSSISGRRAQGPWSRHRSKNDPFDFAQGRGNGECNRPMTKIKNFRVTLRPREMARWLKKERGVETTPELELAIEGMIKESRKWVTPAAVYATLTRHTAEKTTALALPPDAVALSVAAVPI